MEILKKENPEEHKKKKKEYEERDKGEKVTRVDKKKMARE